MPDLTTPDLTTPKGRETYWNKVASDMLKGKVVAEVRYLTDDEIEEEGFDAYPVAIFFTDGTYVFPSKDDEGNGPGALFTSDDNNPILPVLY
jgi:hypothetical protein